MTDDTITRRSWLNGWRIAGWGAALALLALPAIAMQFSPEVAWGPGDFLVMGVLLGALGLGIEWAVHRFAGTAARLMAGAAMLGAFLLVWAELSVGLFD